MKSSVGPYRIESTLGRGGMGVVYRAVHEHLGRQVAIKALAPELTQQPEFKDRFFSEAKTQARLQHPNIVGVYDLLEDGGEYFIVMEFVAGEVLDDRLAASQNVGLELSAAFEIFAQVLAALDYAHSEGVIHRDIKPSNVLITESGRVKLTDFGIALLIGNKRLTASQSAIGTPTYMSPEQIARPRAVDHRTDIYSAGVVFFEMLVGKPPFDEDTEYGIKKMHVEALPPDLSLLRPSLPPALVQAVARALAKNPDERQASAGLFLRELQAALPQFGATLGASQMTPAQPSPAFAGASTRIPPPLPAARTLPPPLPATALPPLPKPARQGAPHFAVSPRLRLVLFAAAALLLVAVSFGIAAFAFKGGREPKPVETQPMQTAQLEVAEPAFPALAESESPVPTASEDEAPPPLDEPAPVPPPQASQPAPKAASPKTSEKSEKTSQKAAPPTPSKEEDKAAESSSRRAPEPVEPRPLAAGREPFESREAPQNAGVQSFARMKELIDDILSLSNKAAKSQESETGNSKLAEEIEAFHEMAEGVREAFRRATGTGVKANLKKIFKRQEDNETATEDLRIQIRALVREKEAIDQRYEALGSSAKAYWLKIRRYVQELEKMA